MSMRELIGSQLSQLTPPARAFLVAAAVLERDLTFERLCSVAQMDELTGLQALEDLIQNGLLREGKREEEVQALDGYCFPGEMIREVVCQEAGITRQRLIQQRMRLMIREELDPGQEDLPDPTPLDRHVPAKIRHGRGKRALSVNKNKNTFNDQNRTRSHKKEKGVFARNRQRSAGRGRGEQGFLAIQRSPPSSLKNGFLAMYSRTR